MIKDTTRYTIEKVENGYSVRKIIYGLGMLSSPCRYSPARVYFYRKI